MKNLTNEDKALCVQLCMNSYEKLDGSGKHGNIDWSMFDKKTVEKFDFNNNEGYIGVMNHKDYGKVFAIVFQGTTDKIDWKYNFDFKQIKSCIDDGNNLVVPYGNQDSKIRMHEGFTEVYYYARDFIREKAMSAFKKKMKILVTGHSLGGAVTTVCYIDLHYMFSNEMEIKDMDFLTGYAAASPAVGNKEFVNSFNKRANGNFYNECYSEDTVHKVPPFWTGYWHVSIEKCYADLCATITSPFFKLIPVAVWNHHPICLYNAILGKPIPNMLEIMKMEKMI